MTNLSTFTGNNFSKSSLTQIMLKENNEEYNIHINNHFRKDIFIVCIISQKILISALKYQREYLQIEFLIGDGLREFHFCSFYFLGWVIIFYIGCLSHLTALRSIILRIEMINLLDEIELSASPQVAKPTTN